MHRKDFSITQSSKRRWRRLVLILAVSLLIVIAVIAISSLNLANALMKNEIEPIAPYATNAFRTFEPINIVSGQDRITLKGWLIHAEKPLRGTIIVAHHQGSNRLPYGMDSARLYQKFSHRGFQTIAFDFRHSGESTGDTSSYGYEESEDLLTVMRWAVTKSGNAPLILYGFGSGTTAIMRALYRLRQQMQPGIPETRVLPNETDKTDANEKDQDQSDIESKEAASAHQKEENRNLYEQVGGLILDNPARGSNAFFRADVKSKMNRAFFWLPKTVPYVARFSLRSYTTDDFYSLFTASTLPVMIFAHQEDSRLDHCEARVMIDERMRLHSDRTLFYEAPGKGFLTAYLQNPAAYENALFRFLDEWAPKQ
jgi:alpha/beta superfamily hydrolase